MLLHGHHLQVLASLIFYTNTLTLMIEKQTHALLTADKRCVYKDIPH